MVASRYAPRQRLTRERLAAADASIRRLQSVRRVIPVPVGLHDYRCIFHAHGDDSAHTGGSRSEILADAVRAGVDVVFLSDHFRPPRDFMESWRFLTNGVLFIPGSECRGFLAQPDASVMASMEKPIPEFVRAVGAGTGLIFLSHIEERTDHDMAGLTGLEIYNRHYDAKRDLTGLVSLASRMTDPADLRELQALTSEFPDGVLGSQIEYPQVYLEKWDRESRTRHLTGVAANDCHHNQVFVLQKVDDTRARFGTVVDKPESMREIPVALRPGIAPMIRGLTNGQVVRLLDVDPYERAFRCVSTHLWATEKTEAAMRAAAKVGRGYVVHTWMGDGRGFRLAWLDAEAAALSDRPRAWMGDETPYRPGGRIDVESPLPGRIRLLRDGQEVARVEGDRLSRPITEPGVYRAESWLELGGEWRPWLYSNPVFLRSVADRSGAP